MYTINKYIIICIGAILGMAMPFIIDCYAQMKYAGLAPSEIDVLSILDISWDVIGIIGSLIRFCMFVGYNALPYLIIAYLVVLGGSRVSAVVQFILNRLIELVALILRDVLRIRHFNNITLPLSVIAEDERKNRKRHLMAIILSVPSIVALNFYFHLGALRGLHDPSIKSTSTAVLVYAFYPIYASLLIAIIYITIWVVGYLMNTLIFSRYEL